MSNDVTVWGIHGGRTGDANTLFLEGHVVGLGWPAMGDLGQLGSNRDAFKTKLAEAYPKKKPNAIPNNAGQLFRFVHEVKVGDLVSYPSKNDRKVHIGRIDGEYEYRPAVSKAYPHHRKVTWLAHIPRTRFSQGALYEIGSALSFFQIKNYADEHIAFGTGKKTAGSTEEGSASNGSGEDVDDTVGVVAEEIENATKDFIIKTLARELKGHPFAEFVGHLLEAMGYRTRVSPPGPDQGIDVVAHKDELGLEPPIIQVQVKSSESNVGNSVVSSLYGVVGSSEYGLFVTLGSYTPNARQFAHGKSNLRLIDGDGLVDLVLKHYEALDARYKGILPLKRVYVPEAIDESEGG